MRKFSWILTGPAAVLGFVMTCAAQTTPSSPPAVVQTADSCARPLAFFTRPWHQRLCPPSVALVDPSSPAKLPDPSIPTTPTADPLPTEGGYKSSFGLGTTVSAGFGI